MAITYKLFLDQRRTRSTGIYPLKVRITYNRKHKEVPLNIALHTRDWNADSQKVKATHPNAKLITVKINNTLAEIQEKALKFETIEKVYSVEDLGAYNTHEIAREESLKSMSIGTFLIQHCASHHPQHE